MTLPSWLEQIRSCLPLAIGEMSWHDPQLTIAGPDWGFNTMNSWRPVDGEKVIVGSDDPGFEFALSKLKGLSIVACENNGASLQCDPYFILSNGCALEFFSATTFESWTMRLPNGGSVIAEPGDADWIKSG